MKGKKTVFCGDIGCYTLGNALPLDMVDTCLCMGAGLNIAQGIEKVEPDTTWLCVCRRLDLLRLCDHRCCQCRVQSGEYDTDRSG